MKKIMLALAILALLAGGVYLGTGGGKAMLAQNKPTATPTLPAVAATQEIVAEGVVAPAASAQLSLPSGGIVSQVLVAEGDQVAADQLLLKLDSSRLANAVTEAEAAEKIAEAQLARVQAGPAPEDIASAESAVEVAKSGVQAAEAAVGTARANLARAQVGPTAESIAIAERRVEVAKNALWGAQAQRDSVCGMKGRGATQADCDAAKAGTQRSEEEVRIAELQLQQAKAGPTPEDVAVASAQVTQALGQVSTAQAQVKQAEASLARARKGATAEDVAVARAQVEQAGVAVERARSALRDGELRAPFAGRVVVLHARAGEYVAPGQAEVQLADLSQWQIETTDLTEINVVRVREGTEVVVTVDALPGVQLPGKVSRIQALGENRRGDITYKAIVALTTQEERLRWNMTAKVNIGPS
jgi:HlyD family secretion protein